MQSAYIVILFFVIEIQKGLCDCSSRNNNHTQFSLVVGELSCSNYSLTISYSVPENVTSVLLLVQDINHNVLDHLKRDNASFFSTSFSFQVIPAFVIMRFKPVHEVVTCSVNASKCNINSNQLLLTSTTIQPHLSVSSTSSLGQTLTSKTIKWWQVFLIIVPFFILIFAGTIWFSLKYFRIQILKVKSGKTCSFYTKWSAKRKVTQQFELNSTSTICIPPPALMNNVLQSPKLFLVFLKENKKHQKVVLNFVNFLQADLGFEVLCEFFSSEEIAADPFEWIEKSLDEADKVIVIWSPSAVEKWNSNCINESGKQDLFTPVLKQIRNDLFRNKDNGKYYFAYFDYCSVENVPRAFTELFHFNLMHNFDELYFRLKGIERYIPGGEIKEEKVMFDRYHDPELNRFGVKLQESINEMNEYVMDNPNWYLDTDFKTDLPDDLLFDPINSSLEKKVFFPSNHLSPSQNTTSSFIFDSFAGENHYDYRNNDVKSYFDEHQMTAGVVLCLPSQNSCHNPNLFPVLSFNQPGHAVDFLPVHPKDHAPVEMLSPDFSFQKQPFTDHSPPRFTDQFFHETEFPGYDHSNISFIDTDSIPIPPDLTTSPVQLAPIDTESDPMNSLMLINNLL